MTREIRVNERAVITRRAGTSDIRARSTAPARKKSTAVGRLTHFFREAVRIKRAISDIITTVMEDLADKTAREGLFGEDRGKGYAGTDVDYVE